MFCLIPGKLYVIKLVFTSHVDKITLANIRISASTSLSSKNNKEFFSVPLYEPIMFIGFAKLEPCMVPMETGSFLFNPNSSQYKIIYKNKILYIPVLDSICFEDAETFVKREHLC